LVEQRIENPRVLGSIPRLATKFERLPVVFSTGSRFVLWNVCAIAPNPVPQPDAALDVEMGKDRPGPPSRLPEHHRLRPAVTCLNENKYLAI
jgi:hypothetical protein